MFERLAEVMRAKKIRGVELTPAEEWQDPFPES
jgi:hypothetical protein